MRRISLSIVSMIFLLMFVSSEGAPRTLQFAGYTWTVKSGSGLGPGPNDWSDSEDNVFVDPSGALHLKITNREGKWYCAEVQTTQAFGFGTYQFQLIGQIDQLDKNVVLGLFKYPTPDVGMDRSNEVDIEIARWGEEGGHNGWYVVWPVDPGSPRSHSFNFSLSGTYTTHRFTWQSDSIRFRSLHGHYDDNTNLFEEWLFQPSSPQALIPQKPTPLFLNLWLHQGLPPSNGQEVEVVVRQVSYIPFLGDLNGDATFDARDLNLLLRVYLGLMPVNPALLKAADVRPASGTVDDTSGDGRIGADDIAWALGRYLGLVTEP